jgi:hypothetical protein
MRMVVATGGIERFDDLHIDRIDPAWRDRGFWLKGCSDAIDLAKELKKTIAPDKSLALMCALVSEKGELAPPRTPAELLEQTDWSPPSLYLFDPESEPWADSGTVTMTPTDRIFPACSRCFMMIFNAHQQDELRRTFVAVL